MRPLRGRLLAGLMTLLLPLGVLADPVGYTAGFDRLYRIDLATGQTTSVGVIGFNDVEGLAFAADGTLYGVADATAGGGSGISDLLIRIDTTTGAGTLIAPLAGLAGQGPGGNLDYGLSFTCDARLWLSSDSTGQIWEVNPASGGTRWVGNVGQPISGLAARGDNLFGLGVGDVPALFRIDVETGTAVSIGRLNVSAVIDDAGLDFDSTGTLWATLDPEPRAVGASRTARIDIATGAGTLTAVSSVDLIGLEGLAIAPVGGCRDTGGGVGPGADQARQIPGPGLPMLALLGLLATSAGVFRLRSR